MMVIRRGGEPQSTCGDQIAMIGSKFLPGGFLKPVPTPCMQPTNTRPRCSVVRCQSAMALASAFKAMAHMKPTSSLATAVTAT